jgi:hypothetical protein
MTRPKGLKKLYRKNLWQSAATNSKETKTQAPGKDGLEEMALRILCNGAVKKDLLSER